LGSIKGEGGTSWPAASQTGFFSMEMVFQLKVTVEISKGGEKKVPHMFQNVYNNKGMLTTETQIGYDAIIQPSNLKMSESLTLQILFFFFLNFFGLLQFRINF
jgi:hypothetical protein